MSPFAALGLEADADERAVKRAYAQRLRAVRPDEDPAGFQALNESYKSALAIIRGRAEAAEAVEDTAPAGEPATWVVESDALDGEHPLRDHGPALDVSARYPAATPEPPDDAFRLDLDRFLADLFEAAQDEGVDLRDWLDRATDGWPLQVKPLVAPHLLSGLAEAMPLIAPERFALIVEAFALDDVLGTVDPLACERLRKALERQWVHHCAVERGRVLLLPERRRDLRRLMKDYGYPGLLTQAVAAVVVARHAALWAAILRWLPLTTKPVMGVLRIVSDGSYDALSPTVDARAVARWRASERVRSRLGWRHWFGIVLVGWFLGAGALGLLEPASQTTQQGEPFDQGTSDLLHEMGAQYDSPVEDRIAAYTRYIASHPPPWSSDVEARVALAAYDKGVDLQEAGRSDDAVVAYKALDRQFAGTTVHDARLYTARGLVNLAFIDVDDGKADQAVEVASRVLSRYDGTDDPEFELQIAMALHKRADALFKLGRFAEALRDCNDVFTRFGTQLGGPIADQVTKVRWLKEQLLMTSVVKAHAP